MSELELHDTTYLAGRVVNCESQVANEELFERILERIHRYFLRVLPNAHEAEDALQETLTLLEDSLRKKKYDPDRSFNTWLWIKARSVYAQWCRSRSKSMSSLPENLQAEPTRSNPEQRLDAEAILAMIARDLGSETHEAFVLYYEGGLTKKEVGEVLGRDAKTIAKRIDRAHALISRLQG